MFVRGTQAAGPRAGALIEEEGCCCGKRRSLRDREEECVSEWGEDNVVEDERIQARESPRTRAIGARTLPLRARACVQKEESGAKMGYEPSFDGPARVAHRTPRRSVMYEYVSGDVYVCARACV